MAWFDKEKFPAAFWVIVAVAMLYVVVGGASGYVAAHFIMKHW